MKKYWQTIALFTFSLLVLGGFYIYMSASKVDIPEFVIHTIDGDENELEGLKLNGSYEMGEIYKDVVIRKDKTESMYGNGSYIRLIFQKSQNPEIKYLMKHYKSFLRKKPELSSQNFFEDESYLAYAGISPEEGYLRTGMPEAFQIDILNKETKERHSFHLKIPDQENRYMSIRDVKIIDGKLKIVTECFPGSGISEEFRVYTIDLKKEAIVKNDLIVSIPETGSGDYWVEILTDDAELGGEPYLLIKIDNYLYVGDGPNEENIQAVLYDLENDKRIELNIPASVLNSVVDADVIDTMMYLLVNGEKGTKVYPYDMKENTLGTPLNFRMDQEKDEGYGTPFCKLMNGKLYWVEGYSPDETKLRLFIGDLKEGRILYQGAIQGGNEKARQNKYHIYVNDIVRERM
jgi:hypothetical protein